MCLLKQTLLKVRCPFCSQELLLPTFTYQERRSRYLKHSKKPDIVLIGFRTSLSVILFIGRIASEATAKYSTVKDFDSANNYDTSLSRLRQSVGKERKKQFIVIHTLGSHFRYNFRYSEQFRKFRPTSQDLLAIRPSTSRTKKN